MEEQINGFQELKGATEVGWGMGVSEWEKIRSSY